MQNRDYVAEYIELKKSSKDIDERLSALEVLIFADPALRSDPRIKVIAGRKTTLITEETYQTLESLSIPITITETRRKTLDEFDVDTRALILSNPKNYVEKFTKESIRIK